jgi:hypothetical protein
LQILPGLAFPLTEVCLSIRLFYEQLTSRPDYLRGLPAAQQRAAENICPIMKEAEFINFLADTYCLAYAFGR